MVQSLGSASRCAHIDAWYARVAPLKNCRLRTSLSATRGSTPGLTGPFLEVGHFPIRNERIPVALIGAAHYSEGMPNPIRAAGYVRVSTAQQTKGESMPAHRERVRKRVEYDGAELVEMFEDAGRSGRKADSRPGLQDLLSRLDDFDRVYIPALDRLGRSARDLHNIAHDLAAANVTLVSVKENIDTSTATGKLLFSVLAAVAEMESDRIGERLEDNRERVVTAGLANPPFGYRYDGHNGYVVVPAQAETVKRIYSEYLAGSSMRQIALALNADGTPSARGGRWTSGIVKEKLENVVYRGDHGSRDGSVRPGVHDPIVSRETWAKAASRREAQRSQPGKGRGRATNALLPGGFLRCAECESGMRPQHARDAYRCSGRDEKVNGCEMPSIRRSTLDAALRDYFLHHVFDPDLSRAEYEAERERATDEAREAWGAAQRAATASEGRRERIKRDYQDGSLTADAWATMDAELAAEAKGATERAEREKRRLDALLAPEDAAFADWSSLRETALADLNGESDREQLRAVLQRLFEYVAVGRIDPADDPNGDLADPDSPTFEDRGQHYMLWLELRPEAMAWATDDDLGPVPLGPAPQGLPLKPEAMTESAGRCERGAGS